eukprot:gene56189-14751_t
MWREWGLPIVRPRAPTVKVPIVPALAPVKRAAAHGQ